MPLRQPGFHDQDFFLWTQEQARALRMMPRSNVLDADNLAEEIEDMGRAELNRVCNLLAQILTHLLKLAYDPDSSAREHLIDGHQVFLERAAIRLTHSRHPGERACEGIASSVMASLEPAIHG